MNTTTLQKCIAELSKPAPDISYVRGMLETLLEVSGMPVNATPIHTVGYMQSILPGNVSVSPIHAPNLDTTPEGAAVDAALASIAGMPSPKAGILEKNVMLN